MSWDAEIQVKLKYYVLKLVCANLVSLFFKIDFRLNNPIESQYFTNHVNINVFAKQF